MINEFFVFLTGVRTLGRRRNRLIGQGRFATMGSTGDARLSGRECKKFYDVLARRFGVQRDFTSIQVIFWAYCM